MPFAYIKIIKTLSSLQSYLFSHRYRQDASNFKAPGLKLLVNKKNIHRLIKVRAEKASDSIKGSVSRTIGSQSGDDIDSEELERETQKERDDKITAEVGS